jgi:hypothetical protein
MIVEILSAHAVRANAVANDTMARVKQAMKLAL